MKAVFVFGRFNPPTIGHEKLIGKLSEVSRSTNAAPFVFLSQTQDGEKNPLPWDKKAYFFSKMFPGVPVVNDQGISTMTHVLEMFQDQGYDDISMVVGDDRVDAFKWIYQYLDDFGIKNFNIISAGERDPDADGATGASASKARELVANNNFEEFNRIIPGSDTLAKMLFKEVQKNLIIQ